MALSNRTALIVSHCLAAAIAFYATAKHPYSFYVFTRWVVFLTCCWGLSFHSKRLWTSIAPAYLIVGLVFNPILPLHFHRSTWHALDIAAGITLLVSLIFTLRAGYARSED